jgi:hypothetical protein
VAKKDKAGERRLKVFEDGKGRTVVRHIKIGIECKL